MKSKRKGRALMVVGTSSFSGKSFIVAALCRIWRDAGYSVAPFKAQNMSLNSAVTADGTEISRAQAFQAMAAGVEGSSDMNPLLLKPKGNGVSQIVLNGRPYGDVSAKDYYDSFVEKTGQKVVEQAYGRLSERYDIIVMEGAGSPAEINLYPRDIANMWAAEMAGADVILVADIERGGVFAGILGTLALLKPEHKKMVKGIIINKFRGDEGLLEPGIKEIQRIVGIPVIGVVPFIENLEIPEEDSQALSGMRKNTVDIAVIRLPRISNFTDFDPLLYDPRIHLRYVKSSKEFGDPDAIMIPGTKSTLSDLEWLQSSGMAKAIIERHGAVPIVGICGGFQILGRRIIDDGVEADFSISYDGLGLLDVETRFESYKKTTEPVKGTVMAGKGLFRGLRDKKVEGYEIHMGQTRSMGAAPVFLIKGRSEGAADRDFMTFGSYLHGLFDSADFREGFIDFIIKNRGKRIRSKSSQKRPGTEEQWERGIKRIAGIVKERVDLSWFI